MQTFMEEKGGLNLPKLAPGATIFEYYPNDAGEWSHWEERVTQYEYATGD